MDRLVVGTEKIMGSTVFGLVSLTGGVAPGLIDAWTPQLQFVALILGIVLGAVTIAIKLKELFKK